MEEMAKLTLGEEEDLAGQCFTNLSLSPTTS